MAKIKCFLLPEGWGCICEPPHIDSNGDYIWYGMEEALDACKTGAAITSPGGNIMPTIAEKALADGEICLCDNKNCLREGHGSTRASCRSGHCCGTFGGGARELTKNNKKMGRYLNSNGTMLCRQADGSMGYVTNDPCYPLCSNPNGSGCDASSLWGGTSAGGPTQNYSVTRGDGRGDSTTRTYVTPIDPYQSITPDDLKFGGGSSDIGNRNLWLNSRGSSFHNTSGPGGTGDTVMTIGSDQYSFDPVLTWDTDCDFDQGDDNIVPGSSRNCKGNSGIPGMNVGVLRYKNGKLV